MSIIFRTFAAKKSSERKQDKNMLHNTGQRSSHTNGRHKIIKWIREIVTKWRRIRK